MRKMGHQKQSLEKEISALQATETSLERCSCQYIQLFKQTKVWEIVVIIISYILDVLVQVNFFHKN